MTAEENVHDEGEEWADQMSQENGGGEGEREREKKEQWQSFLFLVAMPGAPSASLLLVVGPGAPSSPCSEGAVDGNPNFPD